MDSQRLDAEVAEKVMGWKKVETTYPDPFRWEDPYEGDLWVAPWTYSTDIERAWHVVEEMNKRVDSAFGYFLCELCNVEPEVKAKKDDGFYYSYRKFSADNVVTNLFVTLNPKKICLAALKAVNADNVQGGTTK